MTAFDTALDWIGRKVGHRLQREEQGLEPFVPSDAEALRRTLRPADVLLVAGGNKLSTAIKYLTARRKRVAQATARRDRMPRAMCSPTTPTCRAGLTPAEHQHLSRRTE